MTSKNQIISNMESLTESNKKLVTAVSESIEQINTLTILVTELKGEISSIKAASVKEGKVKKPKKIKDPDAPKRPTSAYFYFCKKNRGSVKTNLPTDTKQQLIISELGRLWRELDENGRKPYYKLAEKDSTRFKNEKNIYEENKLKGNTPPQSEAESDNDNSSDSE